MTVRVYNIQTATSLSGGDRASRPSSQPFTVMQAGGTRVALGRSHASCRLCHSDYRQTIEQFMRNGAGWETINAKLPQDAQITEEGYLFHFRECYGNGRGLALFQRILSEGKNELEGYRVADPVAFVNLVVNNAVMQALEGGFNHLKPAEALAFAKALHEMTKAQQTSLNEEVLQGILWAYLDTVRAVTSPEQQAEIARMLDNSPDLKVLALRMQGRDAEEARMAVAASREIAPAEVVEVWAQPEGIQG